MNLIPEDIFEALYWRPQRTIPIRVSTLRSVWSDGIEIRVVAEKDGAMGAAIYLLNPAVLALANKRSVAFQIEHVLRTSADQALSMWLLDHETQQGWPPRECMHDHVDGAEVLS